MTIKLSELKAARAAMAAGEWLVDESDPSSIYVERKEIAVLGYDGHEADASGIVATHNAVDTLLEIVECDLALEPAKLEAAKARYEFYRTYKSTAEIERCERVVRDLESRRKAALAKVTP